MPITMRMRPTQITTPKNAQAILIHFRINKIHFRTVKDCLPPFLFTLASHTSFYRLESRPAAGR